MIDFVVLEQARKLFARKDIPLLNSLINRMRVEKPYANLRIIYNAHMTLSSVVQVEALLLSGAEVTITVADGLRSDPIAIEMLKKAGAKIVPYADLLNEECDIAIDCCAKLLGRAHPKYGAVELTQTGVVKYENAAVNYPVISVDDTELKKIETLFGTGDGFVRGFRQTAKAGLHNKKFLLFGYGKVGKGIVRALSALTQKIVVVEYSEAKANEAEAAGLTTCLITDKKNIFNHLKDTFCIVTATGIEDMMSRHFERSEVQAKHFVNMGSEDEWGPKFNPEEVLNKKLAINFCLEQPTRILFLDPIFYAQNTAIDVLLEKKLKNGTHKFPVERDLNILTRWISEHYQINLEGDYLQSIISHIPCFIYWKDRDSVYQGCNEKFAQAAGCHSPAEVVGKTDYELVWGETEAEIYRKGDQEAFTGKMLLNFEETQQQADGKHTTVLASKVPYRDDDGHIIGVLGIYTDITERKHAEELLQLAKENAEAANLAKTDFLATVSHELRTPLNGILGIIQLLGRQKLSPKVQEYAEDIYEAGKHLLSLVNDMLDFSKLEAGKMEIIPAPVDLKELIEETTDMLSHQAKAKGLDFVIDYEDKVPHQVLADPRAIRQVILNLVSNAIKFTEKGQILMQVSCIHETPNEVELQLSVEDSGIGIPQDKIDLIFERFKQLDSSLSRRYSGTGLGLAIAKQLVEKMNGAIEVKSQVDKGSVFSVKLSFAKVGTSIASPWDAYKAKVRVLIVDDSRLGRVIYKHLGSSDNQVIASNLAFSAFLAAQKNNVPYQIVMIDENLISTDSEALAKKLVNAVENPKPMLVLLAQAVTANTKKAEKSNLFFEQMIKPIQPLELTASLTAAWERWVLHNHVKKTSKNVNTPSAFLKALVVEDNVLNQKVIRLLLRDLGCDVDMVDSGEKVFSLLPNSYDLIFMDIGLPDMTGIEITKKIRQAGYKEVPIIALTAHVFDTDKQSCLKAGMNDIVTKPIMNDQLIEILNRWAKNKRSLPTN